MAWATSSLPEPLSPEISTVASVGATLSTRSRTACMADERPTIQFAAVSLITISRNSSVDDRESCPVICTHWRRFAEPAPDYDFVGPCKIFCQCSSYNAPGAGLAARQRGSGARTVGASASAVAREGGPTGSVTAQIKVPILVAPGQADAAI